MRKIPGSSQLYGFPTATKSRLRTTLPGRSSRACCNRGGVRLAIRIRRWAPCPKSSRVGCSCCARKQKSKNMVTVRLCPNSWLKQKSKSMVAAVLLCPISPLFLEAPLPTRGKDSPILFLHQAGGSTQASQAPFCKPMSAADESAT